MLDDPEYAARWERKKEWYRENGVFSRSEGSGPNGVLVETSDDPKSGFDTILIGQIIDELSLGA